ncbi:MULTISPECIES: LysR family transcriptional regulator [Thalassolituus]|jgi:DNA-binding transcriptional LysR family regulator|uniref:LysR family transcriptional regulator n=1 Tax=Thalassolituus TaxID=187492 RepID=UPI0009494D13|nr:LysR family transcriptional regulator [Thalassolituus oleivorans]APR66226.1 LysR family transcriptional regulator [Thalassolituus oleivorans]
MLIGKREEFDLNEMAIFVHVVEAGSFTGAAKNLGLPKSTVSRKITQLEERLGVRLIQRTTRSLRLTDTGSAYYNHCARILGEIEEANIAVTQMQSTPTGTLRITAPVLFGSTVLSGLIADFMDDHPQVQIDLVLTDQRLDLVQDGIDVAFRVGQLEDSSLIGRHLGDARAILCASPEYVKKHGAPKHPSELQEHTLMTASQWSQWQLQGPNDQVHNLQVKPRLQVNDFASLYTLALAGAGIAPLPMLIAASAIRANNLVPVLSDWPFEASPIHALYPSNRHLSAKVRSFVDFVIESVRPNPPWEVDMDDTTEPTSKKIAQTH